MPADSHEPIASALPRWWGGLVIGGMLVVFFAAPLFQNHGFSFRDTASFYRPRYEWAAQQRAKHSAPPLWNDRIGLGIPVISDATSASFYPAQLVFHLPLSGSRRMVIYVVLHVAAAAAGAWLLARRLGCETHTAALAGIAYAFGGSVLFQYCNVVFLVGAAWLPFNLVCLVRLLRENNLRWMLAWASTLAMMVLGGDPQMAYHAVLLGGLSWLCGLGFERAPAERRRLWPRMFGGAAIAGLLALIQIAPAASWSRESTRAMRDRPRSIYELVYDVAATDRDASAASLFTEPEAGHAAQAYRFSVGPWRWIEWLWPNATGRLFPTNNRWLRVIPSEGRTWSPSLYMSAPVIILALAGLGRGASRRWLLAMVLLAVLASLGRFGVGWLLNEAELLLTGKTPNRFGLGGPVGGVYWLLTMLLPGYAYFRYPAKWMTIAALGLAILAALGWQRCSDPARVSGRRIQAVLVGFAATSLVVAAAVWVATPWLGPLWALKIRTESFFGPFSGAGACQDLVWGAAHGGVAALLAAALLISDGHPWRRCGLLTLVAVELSVANYGLLATAPEAAWQVAQTELAAVVTDGDEKSRVVRVYRGNELGWLPTGWVQSPHADPLGEALRWNAATAYPHLHLTATPRLAVINAPTSIESSRWETWQAIARGAGIRRAEKIADCKPSLLSPLGVETIIVPDQVDWAQHDPKTQLAGRVADNARRFTTQSFPRAWLVDSIAWRPPIDDSDRNAVQQRMREVLFPAGVERDFRTTALLAGQTPESWNDSKLNGADGKVEWREDERERLRLSVTAPGPTCLILSSQFDRGWRVTRRTGNQRIPTPLYRANGVMQAVLIPAGKHELEFVYRPTSILVGGAVSGVAWVVVLGSLAFLSISRARSTEDNDESLDSRERDA